MGESNVLGAYLRARRDLVRPAQVGLPEAGGRRTPGLRREEVATLAGISVDYYVRLEKGQDTNPSPHVLTALARVLQLDQAATEYLQRLQTASAVAPSRRTTVPTGIRLLLDVIGLPAFVESRTFDVLAANRLAGALSPHIRPGANRLRSMFLHEQERRLHADWDKNAATMVAEFRISVGTHLDDPAVVALVEELSKASDEFQRVWTRHDVDHMIGASVRIDHPRAGMLELRREEFPITGSGGQLLVVYFAAAGTEDARMLTQLCDLEGV